MKCVIVLFLFLSCSWAFALAQDSSSVFRHGKLGNGLTYYIRHTGTQPGCADFYLIQNVGSLMEEEEQNVSI